ncbi:MAG TPA: hypothetical protein VNG12_27250, partial [Acidimicrobiales bacterium]|nr:hypothetical protein [Acidimicrobiales bacterium]
DQPDREAPVATPGDEEHAMSPNPALEGLSDDAAVCGSCHQVRGTALAGFHQRCACEPVPDPDEPRFGQDFLMAAELCRCCGLVLLPSGSRWSVWFCPPCTRLARSFNEQLGRCVIPIGRHSLMNGVGLKGTGLPPVSRTHGYAA